MTPFFIVFFVEDKIPTYKFQTYSEMFMMGPVEQGSIPFYWCPSTTTDKFPQFAHPLLLRGNNKSSSPWSTYFEKIVFDFLKSNNIQHKETIRSCLNLSYHIPNYLFIDPHVDNFNDHFVVILYLNDADGNTIIFDKKYSTGDKSVMDYDEINLSEYKILKEISPEKGKIICFDGGYYHALRPPSPGGIRNVCVFNILR